MMAGPEDPGSSGSSSLEGPTLAVKLQDLLERIRGLDKSMDAARLEKIAKIKKALADGTYHVSAADVAWKIIDQMREP
jgi:anti-sigma28 factor (negative regulator of flagellin synthesis)